MTFWRRLRFGYERDLDERAETIALRSYRDALIVTFLLALLFPTLALELGQAARLSAWWPLLPAATALVVVALAQVFRLARGGVTWRVALVGVGAVLILLAVAWGSDTLLNAIPR